MNKNQTTAETTTAELMAIDQLRLLAIPEEFASLLSLIHLAEQKALAIAENIKPGFWGSEVDDLAHKVQDLLSDSFYTMCEYVGKQMGARIYEPERVAELGYKK